MSNQEKQIKVFSQDSVNDEQGLIHHVVACGVGIRGIGIGVGLSITNPSDVHKQELGKIIAEGRATKRGSAAMFVEPNYPLSKHTVQKFVQLVIDDFKAHPEAFIKGFEKKIKKQPVAENVKLTIES